MATIERAVCACFLLASLALTSCGGDDSSGQDGDDECAAGTHDCDPNATCSDTAESFTCECNTGYDGDGTSCADIDECATGTDDCSAARVCANLEGSFECHCPPAALDHGGECVQLDSGTDHSCAIRDGVLSCWGANGSGQLGIGDTTHRPAPTQVGDASDWTQVSTGFRVTCGTRAPGVLYCWGDDGAMLGTPEATDTSIPNRVGSAEDWAQVSVGYNHTCAIKTNGTLYCWGEDGAEQLGNGDDTTTYDTPQPVGSDTDWSEVRASQESTCASKTDGSLYCWGIDDDGQLGNGTELTDYVKSPAVVPGVSGVTDFSTGMDGYNACAISGGETLHCWGANDYGSLGDGTEDWAYGPRQVSGTFTRIAINSTGCAIDPDGHLHCWGENDVGQRGAGHRQQTVVAPQEVDTTRTWLELSAGRKFTCGFADDGGGTADLYCWGENDVATLGLGLLEAPIVPMQVSGTWKRVSSASNTTCGITGDDELWCWGRNDTSVGDAERIPTSAHSFEQEPVMVDAATWLDVAVGSYHACAIRAAGSPSQGQLYCWGENGAGQLGLGNEEPASGLQRVGVGEDWRAIAAGQSSTCGIRGTPGTLYCWGSNGDGQLGTGTTSPSSSPVNVGDVSQDGAEDWLDVSIGTTHTCAAVDEPTQAGSQFALYCWGSNTSGQVGNGVSLPGDDVPSPTRIDVDAEWIVDLGDGYSCGIDDSNHLYCWGDNSTGELGLGDRTDRAAPVQVTAVASWSRVSTGFTHTCGIGSGVNASELYCFGEAGAHLGTGVQSINADDELIPVRVGTASNWQSVVAGSRNSCAINTAGELWCWGQNLHGALGTGTSYRAEPTQVVLQ